MCVMFNSLLLGLLKRAETTTDHVIYRQKHFSSIWTLELQAHGVLSDFCLLSSFSSRLVDGFPRCLHEVFCPCVCPNCIRITHARGPASGTALHQNLFFKAVVSRCTLVPFWSTRSLDFSGGVWAEEGDPVSSQQEGIPFCASEKWHNQLGPCPSRGREAVEPENRWEKKPCLPFQVYVVFRMWHRFVKLNWGNWASDIRRPPDLSTTDSKMKVPFRL